MVEINIPIPHYRKKLIAILKSQNVELLGQKALSNDTLERLMAAANINTLNDALPRLTEDRNQGVADVARETQNVIGQGGRTLGDRLVKARGNLGNQELEDVLNEILKDIHYDERRPTYIHSVLRVC